WSTRTFAVTVGPFAARALPTPSTSANIPTTPSTSAFFIAPPIGLSSIGRILGIHIPVVSTLEPSLLPGIARRLGGAEVLWMGDGKTFAQALRAIDKFVVEQTRRDGSPDPYSPIRLAYERIVAEPPAA